MFDWFHGVQLRVHDAAGSPLGPWYAFEIVPASMLPPPAVPQRPPIAEIDPVTITITQSADGAFEAVGVDRNDNPLEVSLVALHRTSTEPDR